MKVTGVKLKWLFFEFVNYHVNTTIFLQDQHMPWVLDLHCGGEKIPPLSYEKIRKQVEAYSDKRSWKANFKLQVRFKGRFCYIDALEKDGTVSPLGRLRHFKDDKWSIAFYTYSNDRYEPCVMNSGSQKGSLEEGLAVCEMYLI